ncbi:protein-methionine-sulfoxide reductase catalytic subunit MsrP [Pseudooceanicola sp. CBS1P-1]|uniref:Protein-methionine-sulfoxide reductase catalytic subunit MsrP n=1 Tax=Pseudooceanicola albus TaxID=2692189 RepID=A0A6L7GBJ8_9RHOB|nr:MULTISPECIES: protein-methionine-sulfoxide reductase catalytic subunit MsrP [Pseudooceanicola]MBT9386651.1 protein-methionine-sulfoxide reductase catalytic subunit MsrP [Pseudooceanicola endophyticus]MXN20937.1 protein-methionine-sulfoxide reductase catalytic subunit MsrP [Pseudooceanicola albus]
MARNWNGNLTENDVTPEHLWLNRRQIMAGMAGLGLGSIGGTAMAAPSDLTPNDYEAITHYNNFYEFGVGKEDPADYSGKFVTSPWSIEVAGLVDKPGTYALEDILKGKQIEERIYRLRCVEAWSMVIPWNGFPLSALLNQVGVQSGAKYVAFETALKPDEMPGVSRRVLDWPYREGLRLDEAMHPLTLMATGIYGKDLLNQNGAPIRVVVPWKYGFKSAKSIVRITLQEDQPFTSWKDANYREYGFYSNVNPQVSHPRWSQATERVIGSGLIPKRRETEMFNGYGDEVASLYTGMDLKKNY